MTKAWMQWGACKMRCSKWPRNYQAKQAAPLTFCDTHAYESLLPYAMIAQQAFCLITVSLRAVRHDCRNWMHLRDMLWWVPWRGTSLERRIQRSGGQGTGTLLICPGQSPVGEDILLVKLRCKVAARPGSRGQKRCWAGLNEASFKTLLLACCILHCIVCSHLHNRPAAVSLEDISHRA